MLEQFPEGLSKAQACCKREEAIFDLLAVYHFQSMLTRRDSWV